MTHNFQGYDSYFILQYLRENGVKYARCEGPHVVGAYV
jgi:hypothetical protein